MTPYVSPVRGLRVTSFFGPRDGKFHPGIDVISSDQTGPVTSMTNGTVVAEWTYKPTFVKRTGKTVVTQNVLVVGDDGVAVLYSGLAHKEPTLVGSRVAAGTTIGAGGNTDNDAYHTHIEAITPEGVAAMGLSRGVDSRGNAIWLFEGVPVSKLNNANIGQKYSEKTRDPSKANNSNGDIYKLSYLIPPDVVVPWLRSQVDGGKQPQESSWSPETLNAVNRFRAATWGEGAQPISFPDVAQCAQQLTTEKYFGNAPGPNGGQGLANALAPFESRRTDVSRPVPYLDSTNAAQQLFAKVPPLGVSSVPSGASPNGAINPAGEALDSRFRKWGSSPAAIPLAVGLRPSGIVQHPLWKLGLCSGRRFRQSPFSGLARAREVQEIDGARRIGVEFSTKRILVYTRVSAGRGVFAHWRLLRKFPERLGGCRGAIAYGIQCAGIRS